jgi:hypothetical protein
MGGGGGGGNVQFAYKPQWKGVTKIEVVGAFGQATDWMMPFATLTDDGSGTWSATADLADGKYPYLFVVYGDDDQPGMPKHTTIDPSNPGWITCPAGSPTAKENPTNPCAELTVPQPAAATQQHVTGLVQVGGAAAKGYLVVIERVEMGAHHFFANRTTVGANGKYDLLAAPGQYRLQVLAPEYYTKDDTQRTPLMDKVLKRAISSAFDTTADVAVGAAEMQFLDYDKMTPTGTATLPTTFQFATSAGATAERVAVHGSKNGMGKRMGDPWFTTPYGMGTSATFDGTFTTKQALEMTVAPGEQYWWSVNLKRSAGGTVWAGESMVMPIKW